VNPRLVAPVATLVLLTGCSAGSDEADVAAPPSPAASATASAAASPVASPTPAGTVVEVTYAGGQVTGVEPRVPVTLGEQVVLRFTSDVVEEIHVHGYDLYADLVPGQTEEIAFTADIAGSFEVELHEAGRPLFQLRVAP
jgi:hypothetical protein